MCRVGSAREAWAVDQLTRKVYVHSVTAMLGPTESEPLLEATFQALPATLQERLTRMSPVHHVGGLRAPLIVLLHDRHDPVIPVTEARQLRDALAGHGELHYTEFTVFKHLDPTKGKPAAVPLAREMVRFAHAIYPLFRRTTEPSRSVSTVLVRTAGSIPVVAAWPMLADRLLVTAQPELPKTDYGISQRQPRDCQRRQVWQRCAHTGAPTACRS